MDKVYKIELIGKEQFKSSYSIYIIVLNHCNDKYFYIGQTGDRNNTSARSPFLRLAGHLDKQKKSTQNQLYRGIIEKILKTQYNETNSKETYESVENILINTVLTMYTFPIYEFYYNISEEKHKEMVANVEEMENKIIVDLIQKFGEEHIINKKYSDTKCINQEFIDKAKQIEDYVIKSE
ncbi:MAG: hypothetical protein LBR16_05810 [Treponema sp.]|jgi:hypothetical protein|nr:hypothetical protein [Treponema sp.]